MTCDKALMTSSIHQIKAEFFKTLGHPARIRVLEVLRDGGLPVNELAGEVGIEASHLSQHLGVLRRTGLVQVKREGTSAVYSISDPAIYELLDVARRILTASLGQTQALLKSLEIPKHPDS